MQATQFRRIPKRSLSKDGLELDSEEVDMFIMSMWLDVGQRNVTVDIAGYYCVRHAEA